jgi:hypothetical protein
MGKIDLIYWRGLLVGFMEFNNKFTYQNWGTPSQVTVQNNFTVTGG